MGRYLLFSYFLISQHCAKILGTLESVKQVEMLAEDTYVYHQLHKRVWPSTQRETLFASHLCTLHNAPQAENAVGHTWMVCNFSINRDDIPVRCKVVHLYGIKYSCSFCEAKLTIKTC